MPNLFHGKKVGVAYLLAQTTTAVWEITGPLPQKEFLDAFTKRILIILNFQRLTGPIAASVAHQMYVCHIHTGHFGGMPLTKIDLRRTFSENAPLRLAAGGGGQDSKNLQCLPEALWGTPKWAPETRGQKCNPDSFSFPFCLTLFALHLSYKTTPGNNRVCVFKQEAGCIFKR